MSKIVSTVLLISQAKELRGLILKYDRATMQIHFLDEKLEHLNNNIFAATLDGSEGYIEQCTRTKAVIEGTKAMYETYKQKTWQKVHELSILITSQLNCDSSTIFPALSSVAQGSVVSAVTRNSHIMMNLTQQQMERFCIHNRHS